MSRVKRARTTRTETGSSSQEQEVADPMMTLERRMEYLRGWPVAKERPVTLSDFDQLLYEENSLYQLFEYQGFLHQLSWTEGFCVDAVVQDFLCALVSVDRAPEINGSRRGGITAFDISVRGTYGDGAPVVPPPWVAQLFADLDSRVGTTVKATLQPVERQMQSLKKQLKELRTAFDGECTVTMLRNKSVVAHMADVNEQLEEIKKTLDDFKTEADPQRIPGDIPDDVATFRDAVRR
ncbi:hypothetical protein CJ030_MR8G000567 [Morella rubra]|uniref:Uncharacterized protein n=1 Tax=Morella rubra TaxID=262757 RepID=A0A6A1UUB8_9ROSI|nr:hypothetical protein CJ030_MR8G000567 [Morella rubra]